MILTVQTTEIATRAGDREAFGAWMEVIQWLFLNGVDSQRTGFAIDLASEHTVLVAPTPTDARLAVCNMAVMRTELTLYPALT